MRQIKRRLLVAREVSVLILGFVLSATVGNFLGFMVSILVRYAFVSGLVLTRGGVFRVSPEEPRMERLEA